MVQRINRLVKGREGFRPFAPSVMAEHAAGWFELDEPSPYMLRTVRVRGARPEASGDASGLPFSRRLDAVESPLPAVTHVDGSARVQTVDASADPRFHALLRAFHDRTGCPVLLNTSFNRAGEPIVRTPAEALACQRASGLDLVVIEGCVVGESR